MATGATVVGEATSGTNGSKRPPAPVIGPREIELKLLAPEGVLAALGDSAVVARHARNRGLVRRLEAIYYDTPSRLLFGLGMSLRVRRSGKHYVQTLKRAAADAGPLVRDEWECPVEDMTPDLSRLPAAQIGEALAAVGGEALVAVFATKVRRLTRAIELPDATVELAFDDGTIEAGGHSAPLSEVEIELKTGDAGAIYDFAMALLDVAPLRVGTLSKAERGFQLAYAAEPRTVKASSSGVSAEGSVDDAVAVLLAGCQAQVMANQAAAERGVDPEGVHQMRVALRRLRSAVSVFKREVPSASLAAVSAEAKWVAAALGPARNWDVLLGETLAGIEAGFAAQGRAIDLSGLRAAGEPRRAAAYEAVRAMLADPRYSRFLLALGRLIERHGWRTDVASETLAVLCEPLAPFAGRALSRLDRKAAKQGEDFKRLSPEARHELRITLKKLRYAAEFFRPVYAEAGAKRYLRRLSALQDALGAANDVATALPLLDEICRETTAADVHRAAGAVVGWQLRDCREAGGPLKAAWSEFKDAKPFWEA